MHRYDALVVGAGFGGLGAAIELKRLGYDDILIVDREDGLGGTWHVNRYPGLAVDIASVTYSYSFAPNPYWSHVFAKGAELKSYAEHVADKFDLRRHIRFRTSVDSAEWDDDAKHWTVRFTGGETAQARYLLTATGFLSQPKKPDISGVDDFAGTVLHSAAWDDSVDLTGKRVAVIGTGATAVQLIPKLARAAVDLTVYQRTAIWVTPKLDGRIPKPVQRLFARLPFTQRAARAANSALLELIMVVGVLNYRRARLANKGAELLALGHLRRQVRDPETRAKLKPDYSFGCKRPTFSNNYYPTFNRPNVHLETTPIDHIAADGIVTADGRKTDVDTLVLATGFDLWDANFPAIQLTGREGRDLGKWWRETRFQAYCGVTVPRFPNLISLNSPYSYNGLSYFWTIESQMKHMNRLFTEMKRRGATVFEVTDEANDAFLARMTDKLQDSVFYVGNCAPARSYYFNHQGEAALLRPTSTRNGLHEATHFPLESYTYA